MPCGLHRRAGRRSRLIGNRSRTCRPIWPLPARLCVADRFCSITPFAVLRLAARSSEPGVESPARAASSVARRASDRFPPGQIAPADVNVHAESLVPTQSGKRFGSAAPQQCGVYLRLRDAWRDQQLDRFPGFDKRNRAPRWSRFAPQAARPDGTLSSADTPLAGSAQPQRSANWLHDFTSSPQSGFRLFSLRFFSVDAFHGSRLRRNQGSAKRPRHRDQRRHRCRGRPRSTARSADHRPRRREAHLRHPGQTAMRTEARDAIAQRPQHRQRQTLPRCRKRRGRQAQDRPRRQQIRHPSARLLPHQFRPAALRLTDQRAATRPRATLNAMRGLSRSTQGRKVCHASTGCSVRCARDQTESPAAPSPRRARGRSAHQPSDHRPQRMATAASAKPNASTAMIRPDGQT